MPQIRGPVACPIPLGFSHYNQKERASIVPWPPMTSSLPAILFPACSFLLILADNRKWIIFSSLSGIFLVLMWSFLSQTLRCFYNFWSFVLLNKVFFFNLEERIIGYHQNDWKPKIKQWTKAKYELYKNKNHLSDYFSIFGISIPKN